MKITTTRLSELTKGGQIAKTEESDYKMTTIGIKRLQDETLSKIRAKLKDIFGLTLQ